MLIIEIESLNQQRCPTKLEKEREEGKNKRTRNTKQASDEVCDRQLQRILQRLENPMEVEGHDTSDKENSDLWSDDSMHSVSSDITMKHDNGCMSLSF